MTASTRGLAWVLHSDRFGGMEKYVALALRHVDRTRYRPHLVLPSSVSDDPSLVEPLLAELDPTIEVVSVRAERTRRTPSAIAEIQATTRVFRKIAPAVVHFHSADPLRPLWAAIAARRLGVPVTVRTDHLPPPPTPPRLVDRMTRRRADRWLDAIVVPSEGNRREHIERLQRKPAVVRTVYNGIDLTAFEGAAGIEATRQAKVEMGWPADVPSIGVIARLDAQKAIDVLLRALHVVQGKGHRFRAVIVGEGPLESDLRALVDDLGLTEDVVFAGYQPSPVPFLRAFDVAVLPSLFEGFSLSMMEYMAACRACVFSDHPSFIEAVGGEDAALITPRGDASALASAIESLLVDPQRRAELGANARNRAERCFAIEQHTNALMDLYDTLGRVPTQHQRDV